MSEPLPQQSLTADGDASPRIVRFGPFELNLTTAELRRQGRVVNMRHQSMRILIYLVEHAGEVVSREDLQTAVWPSGTFIEFESGLYTAVNQMRQALGESAGKPYFIETIPKVGYRFTSPVHVDLPEAPPPAVEPVRARPRLPLALVTGAAILVLGIGGIAAWYRLRPAPPALDHLRPFTTERGRQDRPAFSPDGEMMAFWNSSPDGHASIYVQRLDATTPMRLTTGVGNEKRPVWSPDGRQIAFLRDAGPGSQAIVSVPLIGSEERKWAEFKNGATPWFDWSRDGKWFAVAEPVAAGHGPAIVLISPATGERRVITNPPPGWRGDSLPVFSPDSSVVAFRRTMVESSVEDIYEVPLAGGAPKRLTFDNRMIRAFSFTPNGALIFASKRDSSLSTLWWLSSAGGRLANLTPPTTEATSPAVSRDGKHFAFSRVLYDVNIWRINADGTGTATPLIDSPLPDTGAQFSPDNRRIAFASDRSGSDEVWVSDAQGNNAVRLTDGRGAELGNPKWSPDGRRIAFEWQPAGKSEIYLISSEGGAPRKLVADGYQNSLPSWSHDGSSIYFMSNRSGQRTIWRVPAEGGSPEQVTGEYGFAPLESPDGQYLYYFRNGNDGEVWRTPVQNGKPAGKESRVLAGLRKGDWGSWTPADDGIYYISPKDDASTIEYLGFAGGAVRTVYKMLKPPPFGSAGLALSRDGQTLIFAQVDQHDNGIFVQ